MMDQTAESVCKGLLQGWIYRHGPPRIILSDQGPNVDGLVREMLKRFGIEKRRSSPYHPEGDVQAERGVQNVKQAMRCLLQERNIEKNDWPSILKSATSSTTSQITAQVTLPTQLCIKFSLLRCLRLMFHIQTLRMVKLQLRNGWTRL